MVRRHIPLTSSPNYPRGHPCERPPSTCQLTGLPLYPARASQCVPLVDPEPLPCALPAVLPREKPVPVGTSCPPQRTWHQVGLGWQALGHTLTRQTPSVVCKSVTSSTRGRGRDCKAFMGSPDDLSAITNAPGRMGLGGHHGGLEIVRRGGVDRGGEQEDKGVSRDGKGPDRRGLETMTAKTCYFVLAGGLNGCYMPDSVFGHFAVTTRRDLMNAVRDAMEYYDLPKSAMREVRWSRLWSQAKRHGTSSIHFSIGNKRGFGVQFMGLTQAEYDEREAREDW